MRLLFVGVVPSVCQFLQLLYLATLVIDTYKERLEQRDWLNARQAVRQALIAEEYIKSQGIEINQTIYCRLYGARAILVPHQLLPLFATFDANEIVLHCK